MSRLLHACTRQRPWDLHLDAAQVVEVGAIIGGAKGHEVCVRRAELHAAHIRLGINSRNRVLRRNDKILNLLIFI